MIKYGSDPKVFPSLKEFWRKSDASKLINDANKDKIITGGHNAYFYIGFYKTRRENIHSIIKIIFYANDIAWLRTQMPYRRFTNIGGLIKGYLLNKLQEVLE